MSEGFVLVHMHIESEKDNLAESRQKSGRQKWLSCTVVGISSEASAVYCCAPVAVRVLISGVQLWDFNARFQVLCCLCLPWNVCSIIRGRTHCKILHFSGAVRILATSLCHRTQNDNTN